MGRMVVADDLAIGVPKGSHGDEAHDQLTIAGEGPPPILTISARARLHPWVDGNLHTVLRHLETGRAIWKRDVQADNQSPQLKWGRSSSPLAVNDSILVTVCGAARLFARRAIPLTLVYSCGTLETTSRATVRRLSSRRSAAYGPPVGTNDSSIAGHDPASGHVLWSHPWRSRRAERRRAARDLRYPASCCRPVYGMGSRLLEISRDGDAATQLARVGEHATEGQVH